VRLTHTQHYNSCPPTPLGPRPFREQTHPNTTLRSTRPTLVKVFLIAITYPKTSPINSLSPTMLSYRLLMLKIILGRGVLVWFLQDKEALLQVTFPSQEVKKEAASFGNTCYHRLKKESALATPKHIISRGQINFFKTTPPLQGLTSLPTPELAVPLARIQGRQMTKPKKQRYIPAFSWSKQKLSEIFSRPSRQHWKCSTTGKSAEIPYSPQDSSKLSSPPNASMNAFPLNLR